MRRSGLADSPFFSTSQKLKRDAAPISGMSPAEKVQERGKSRTGAHRPAKPARQPAGHDTVIPRNRETTASQHPETLIESIRKAVKEFGKEAATHRFTMEEKKAIADIVYAYKVRGVRTSENQIARIAVNLVVSDHRKNGDKSILDRALIALNR